MDMVKVTTLESTRGWHAVYLLQYRPAGHYLAGSGTRYQARDVWAATCYKDGAYTGREYRTRADAEAHYRRMVARDAETAEYWLAQQGTT